MAILTFYFVSMKKQIGSMRKSYIFIYIVNMCIAFGGLNDVTIQLTNTWNLELVFDVI